MSKKTNLSDKLLWIDLEMTGLDPEKDKIMEVAAIISDWDFNEIATIISPVRVSSRRLYKRMKSNSDFWDANSSVRDRLISQNLTAPSNQTVESMILEFIEPYVSADQKIILAGNSIHQDRKFIDNEWKRLSKKLHYRMLDVSAWKVVFEAKYKKQFLKAEEHKAIEDIKGSILELKNYIKYIKI